MAVGIQNLQTLFKTYYDKESLPWLIPDNLPFLNLINKDGGLTGDIIDHPFKYGAAQGYSTDFATAQSAAGSAPRAARASLRCSQAYDFVEFYDKDVALSQGEGAYEDLVTATMTGKIKDFNKNLDLDLHCGGTGWRGTVAAVPGMMNPFTGATLAANQIAITSAFGLEAVFDQDQLLQAAQYAGFPLQGSIFPPADGRLPTSLSSQVMVTAVDGMARTLTLTDASAFVVGSFIVHAGGAIGFNSANTMGSIIGADAWNPYGGVSANDQFCSLNRSVYPTRLAGYWMDGSRFSIEDAIKRLSARMSNGGARSTTVGLINPLDFDALDSKLGSNVHYGNVQSVTVGFDSIVINGASGRIDMISDPHQPQGYVRLIDPSTWTLSHNGDMPHIVDVEGKTMEQANFDGRTARLRFYGQLRCFEPQKNGIVKLPAVNL